MRYTFDLSDAKRVSNVGLAGRVRWRVSQPRAKRTAPERKTRKIGGSVQEASKSLAEWSKGQPRSEPAPKSWRIWAACSGSDGKDFLGDCRASKSDWTIPIPSDDLRSRKTPLRRRVIEPRAKTMGVGVNLRSVGAKYQT